jgi:glycolate oxidase
LQTITPEGGVAVAKAAAEFGSINFVSSVTQPTLEEIAASTEHPKIFQLYIRGDLDWCKAMVDRVLKAGYFALCLTVDTAHYSRRERQMMNRYLPPNKRTETTRHYQGMLTWELIAAIKRHAGLPFILKGVATAEDAKIALDHGVDVIYVSNHGGRQLDHGRGSIEVLPEVVKAVAGRSVVMVDGSFMRGTDVVKAIALGAQIVGIGRLSCLGLAAAADAGLVRTLELLEDEIRITMGLLGVHSLAQLDPSYLHPAAPVTVPHVTSAFPLLDLDDRRY